MSQTPAFPADPETLAIPSNRVQFILPEIRDCNFPLAAVPESVETSISGGSPDPALRISMDGPSRLFAAVSLRLVSDECPLSDALQLITSSNPHVSFAVLEQCAHLPTRTGL